MPRWNKSPRKPRVIAYTSFQGDSWKKWEPTHSHLQVQALLFQDGAIWDCLRGWRPRSSWYTQLRIRQIRNIWRQENAQA